MQCPFELHVSHLACVWALCAEPDLAPPTLGCRHIAGRQPCKHPDWELLMQECRRLSVSQDPSCVQPTSVARQAAAFILADSIGRGNLPRGTLLRHRPALADVCSACLTCGAKRTFLPAQKRRTRGTTCHTMRVTLDVQDRSEG